MKKEALEEYRPGVVGSASGVVLEVGFGPGLNLPYYQNVTNLYAVDPSEELFKLAKEKIDKVSFPVKYFSVSAEQIPLADNSVDTVVSTWSLCSIPHPENALKEIFRALKPNGKFCFIEHGKSSNNFVATWQKILTPISKCVAGGCNMDREIERLIINAGFRMEKLKKIPQKNMPLTFMYQGVAICDKK